MRREYQVTQSDSEGSKLKNIPSEHDQTRTTNYNGLNSENNKSDTSRPPSSSSSLSSSTSSSDNSTPSTSTELASNEIENQETTIEFCSLPQIDEHNNESTNNNKQHFELQNLPKTVMINNSGPEPKKACPIEPTSDGAEQKIVLPLATKLVNGVNNAKLACLSPSIYAKSPSLFRFREGKSKKSSEHFTISWHKLDYVRESKWYKLASQRKPILSGLSGEIKSGELTAILGPSGAGKSTLIDCLIGKHERGMSGRTQVTFNDFKLETERRKNRPLKIALIPQQDHLLETLTVTETFMFASRIKNAHLKYEEEDGADNDSEEGVAGKNPNRVRRPFDHFANVQRVLSQLHLSSCASLRCSKLSGGQYKRVSIGQELLSRPDLMILDEPTSGLDSVTCFNTIRALRDLIDESPYPMAVVATIHQPDIEVFNLFHKAYVLATGGRAIFEGSSDDIFPAIRAALKIVDARRSSWKLNPNLASAGALTSTETLDAQLFLSSQLDDDRTNPARLIVEAAAQEYGYEISNALAELQSRKHEQCNQQLDENEEKTRAADSLMSCNSSNLIYQMALESPTNFIQRQQSIPAPIKGRRPQQDQLLCLIKSNNRRQGGFLIWWKHLLQNTHRSWLTIVRDPMLFWVQLALHILVPLLISYSFQNQNSSEQGDACPRLGQLDVVNEAYRMNGTVLEDLNTELRVNFENIGYIFFQIYVIIFAAVCVTSLTYPLVMHVLLKEYRNGWYSISSYFLGRTLADLPIPAFNVVLAMGISYHLTGQPTSVYMWRFQSVALLTVLATLVAQTWGLIFGALLMNLPQSAVFVAPASTAPLVVVSGFLIRISSLPVLLQHLSKLSYFTHLLNGVIVARYGFGRCPCSEEDFEVNKAHQVPQQARGLIDIWIQSFASEYQPTTTTILPETITNNQTLALVGGMNSTQEEIQPVDLVAKLVSTISKAQTFGHKLDNCDQVKPFIMLDYELEDSHLFVCLAALTIMLLFFRWLTYVVLSWKISSSL